MAVYKAELDIGISQQRKRLEERTFAEFFAGIGLMRLGLENAGWRVKFANDIEKNKYDMYAAQFRNASEHFKLGDVHELSVEDIPSCTLATASFPCTDLSLAGMREGLSGKQSSAYWGFVRLLKELGERRPPFLLIENVPGFLTSHRGKDFLEATIALSNIGYAVDAAIIDAAHFVPQSRVRLFIMATLKPKPRAWAVQETATSSLSTPKYFGIFGSFQNFQSAI